jgi:hypothetical protein
MLLPDDVVNCWHLQYFLFGYVCTLFSSFVLTWSLVFSLTTEEVDCSHDSLVKKLSNRCKKMHRREWSNKLSYLKEKGMPLPLLSIKFSKHLSIKFGKDGKGSSWLSHSWDEIKEMAWIFYKGSKHIPQTKIIPSFLPMCVRFQNLCCLSFETTSKIHIALWFSSSHLFSLLGFQILLFSHTWKGLQCKEKPHNIWSLHIEEEKAMCSVWTS